MFKAPTGYAFKPHQIEGIRYAMERPHVLLADEMRLGKTIQTAGVITHSDDISRALVICPAHLILNWRDELNKWLMAPLSVGLARETMPNTDIVIISYDMLTKQQRYTRDGEEKMKQVHRFTEIREINWDLLVVDEAHYMKNEDSLRSRYILGVGRGGIKARRKLFLTGSPMPNRPIDLWPLIHALAPRSFPDKHSFALRYCDAFKADFGWDYSGASNLGELHMKLEGTVMLRRRLRDVKKDYKEPQRQVIKLEKSNYLVELAAEWGAAKECPGWEQAVQDLTVEVLPDFAEMTAARHATALAKIPDVIKHLEDAILSSKKVVCFAHHHDVIEGLAEHFKGRCVTYYGRTTPMGKYASEKRFRQNPEIVLFIGQIIAAGTGIDLAVANHVVMAELDWVPGNMDQDEKRVESMFKDEPLLVQHLVVDGSLDAYMAKTVLYKQKNINAVVEG